MLQPINVFKLRNWPDILPALLDAPGTVVNGEHYWVPVDWGQTSVAYRTDLAPEYVDNETGEILWDPKCKGRVAVFCSLVDGAVVAGIVAGMPDPFDYSSEAALETVASKLKALAENVRFFSNDATVMEQALASGELVAATAWNYSAIRLINEGLPAKLMCPREGAMTRVCGLSLAKDAEHPEKGLALIDAYLDPRSRAWEIQNFGFGGSTNGGFELVDEATLASVGLSKNPDEILLAGIYQRPIKGEQKLQELFEAIKAGI